jgi:signal transduction histidine kinase
MFFRPPGQPGSEAGHTSSSPVGSGLGLFIVKETVEKMNGKIMLSSKEGEGACFRIDLPLVA